MLNVERCVLNVCSRKMSAVATVVVDADADAVQATWPYGQMALYAT